MDGARISLDGAENTIAGLSALSARAAEPQPMWDEIGSALVVSTQRRFEDGRAPSGSPWPPSIRAMAEGGKTLIDTARLMQSVTHVASDQGVEVGTNVLYAAAHQFGVTIRPVTKPRLAFKLLGKWVFTDEVTLPARPFLGLDAEDETEILAIAEEYVAGPLGGADAR